jgi:hypothetical protein
MKRAKAMPEAVSAPTAEREAAPETTNSLAPETLARTLRAMAAELERDPALARRVARAVATPEVARADTSPQLVRGDEPDDAEPKTKRTAARTFRPRIITGAGPELGTGVPDPFVLRQKLGEAGLRAALAELRLGSLRAIVREHGLDPEGRYVRQNDAEKLRAIILAAAAARSV